MLFSYLSYLYGSKVKGFKASSVVLPMKSRHSLSQSLYWAGIKVAEMIPSVRLTKLTDSLPRSSQILRVSDSSAFLADQVTFSGTVAICVVLS